MSVIIKNAQMPKSCKECCWWGDNGSGRKWCLIEPLWLDTCFDKDERHANCPLVKIPDGHGRLIDESKLERNTVVAYEPYCGEMMNHHREIAVFDDEIKNTPTILEAEVTK